MLHLCYFVFIYLSVYPTRFQYHMMAVALKTTGATVGEGTAYFSASALVHPLFLVGFVLISLQISVLFT